MQMSSTFNSNPSFKNFRFLLGSKSPRRRDLLQMLDIQATPVSINVEETIDEPVSRENEAAYLAKKKSLAYAGDLSDRILITSDTTVLHNDQILNKPEDANDARDMLMRLSGDVHTVITGVCLRTNDKMVVFDEHTEVRFKQLSKEEIDYYIATYKPYDKAGAYGIQEWIGLIGVEGIRGCYYNVMGLPTSKLYTELCKFVSTQN
jgi:septum formation protein